MSDKTIRDLDNVTKNDPASDYLLISQEGEDRKQLLRELEEVFLERFIGTINAFATNGIPEGFLICNGAKVLISDYPQLYNVIGDRFKNHYVGDKNINPLDENTEFVLPNLTNRYLTQTGEDNIGEILPDTMRKITGRMHAYAVQTANVDPQGAFTRITTSDMTHSSNVSGDGLYYNYFFDSKTGISGQEGTQSPNVGEVTRPTSVVITYAILAKVA